MAFRNRFNASAWGRARGPVVLAVILAGFAAGASVASERSAAVTRHQAVIEGKTIDYTVEASRLPIRDVDSGEVRGRIFYVAYRVQSADGKPRPVMFSWGGGPSGPAIEMQMTYGPKMASDDGGIADNDLSLLPVADLVFVDPVGTGFSRPEKGEYLAEFLSTKGDARSVAEFVRVWVATHDAENLPIFLNGQSYGVWRAAIVSELLAGSRRHVAGILITSGGMGLGDEFVDRPYQIAYRVADYAATAFAHGKLPADLGSDAQDTWRKGRAWARDVYGPALSRIGDLGNDERERIARELSRRTGYPLDKINRQTLAFTPPEYLRDFLGEEGGRLNTFDMRKLRETYPPRAMEGEARSRVLARYLREDLGYKTDLAYIGLESGYTPVTAPDYRPPGARWNYDSGESDAARRPPPDGGPPGREPWVLRAITADPAMQIFVEAAVYDSLNFCAANDDRRRRMPPDIADNFELHCYFAGHGSFRDPATHPALIKDMRAFIRRVAR